MTNIGQIGTEVISESVVHENKMLLLFYVLFAIVLQVDVTSEFKTCGIFLIMSLLNFIIRHHSESSCESPAQGVKTQTI